MLVLPSANADERRRSDCRHAERGPRGHGVRALTGWVRVCWTIDFLDTIFAAIWFNRLGITAFYVTVSRIQELQWTSSACPEYNSLQGQDGIPLTGKTCFPCSNHCLDLLLNHQCMLPNEAGTLTGFVVNCSFLERGHAVFLKVLSCLPSSVYSPDRWTASSQHHTDRHAAGQRLPARHQQWSLWCQISRKGWKHSCAFVWSVLRSAPHVLLCLPSQRAFPANTRQGWRTSSTSSICCTRPSTSPNTTCWRRGSFWRNWTTSNSSSHRWRRWAQAAQRLHRCARRPIVFPSCRTDEGSAVPHGGVPLLQSPLGRPGTALCAGWGSGLAHLVGLFMGRHGARHLLHHLRHEHGSLCLLRPHQAGKTSRG